MTDEQTIPEAESPLPESPVVSTAGADATDSTEAAPSDVASDATVASEPFGLRLMKFVHDAEGKVIRTAEEIFQWCKENI